MRLVKWLDGVYKHEQKMKAVILHRRASYHAEHPDWPLVLASSATACSGVTLTLFSTASSGVKQDEHEDNALVFAVVFTFICKLGGEAASRARGLQSFARITEAKK